MVGKARDVITDAMVLVGVVAAIVFVAVLLIEGALRPGYDPSYHTGSELELGERGWIQRTSFFVMGVGVFAFALGVQRSLETTVAGQLGGGWRVYTMVTAGVGLVLTAWTAVAYQKDAPNTGLVQRGLIIVYWSWIVAVGIHLMI